MCTIGKTDIRSTYKFYDSYCQPKFFPDSIMIIIGLHADNKKLELLLSACSLIALGQDAPEGHHRLQ